MNTDMILTGITPSGTPHLGNYLGAIKPALNLQSQNQRLCYFIADYHSLVKLWDANLRQQYINEIAATWLALGLDPAKAIFYRQSEVPEILELNWILTSITAKGLMNRAHAYKDQVAANLAKDESDEDTGITMGLFSYPILMSADILLFKARYVPVGKDQIQHLEMARDIAARFNHIYGETFILPEAHIDTTTPTLPGLDGRKMSKSYGNAIPLFAESNQLRKLINKIKTNSLLPGEPKSTIDCTLFQLYSAFANETEKIAMAQAYEAGIAWGKAKELTFEKLDADLKPFRERYQILLQDRTYVREILLQGAQKARALAVPFLAEIKHKMGIS